LNYSCFSDSAFSNAEFGFNKENYGHFGLPLFAIILGLFDICLLIITINALTEFFIVLAISLIFLVFFSKLGV
jgi:hypothetical protein